jgi:hypothetical protein
MIFDLDLIEHINYRDDYIRLPVPRRYIRDADNPLVYYNDNEFRRRYRFYKESVLNILMPLVMIHQISEVSRYHQLLLKLLLH